MLTRVVNRARAGLGYTLVEVLVALLVMTVGMLGVVAMLVEGLLASRLALQQTEAVALAADLGDRIRANRVAGNAYALAAGTELAAPAETCLVIDVCGPSEVAGLDLYDWQQMVVATLPGAQTSVTVVPAGEVVANVYTITIRWTQTGDSAPAGIVLEVQA